MSSLHYHFPWLVKALLKWSIYCAAVKRKPRLTLDWAPYFEIADNQDMSFDDKLVAYDAIAARVLDEERFDAFCAEHLSHFDEVADAFFGTQRFYDITQSKVEALFPKHEIKVFTDLFYARVQAWREHQA